jgi:hypothetical protein
VPVSDNIKPILRKLEIKVVSYNSFDLCGIKIYGKGIQTRLFNRDSTVRCLGLHFSGRTVRLIEMFIKIPNQVI